MSLHRVSPGRDILWICMADIIIFYFSGSGNSLIVARDLADLLGAELVSVSAALKSSRPFGNADALGFVFPLVDTKPNRLVRELAERLEDPGERYLFALCTYGLSPGRSLKKFSRVFQRRDGRLSAGFAVAMPQSGIGSARSDAAGDDAFYEAWNSRKDAVAGTIRKRETLSPESQPKMRAFLDRRVRKMVPVIFKLIGLLVTKGPKRLAMAAGERCVGCGTCTRLCPTGNITMAGGRPTWGTDCAACFACIHWCPREAVSFGGYMLDTRRRHHPSVTLEDMLLSAGS